MVRYIQFIPLPSLIIFISILVVVLVYLLILFNRRKILQQLSKKDGIAIIGLPNSGKTTLARWLSDVKLQSLRFISRINCGWIIIPNKKIAVYDVNLFDEDGNVNQTVAGNLKLLKPKICIGTIDASKFSKTISEQLECISRALEDIKFKEAIFVLRKLEDADKERLKQLPKNVWKVNDRNVKQFKQKLLKKIDML